jgi:hypothetical protein
MQTALARKLVFTPTRSRGGARWRLDYSAIEHDESLAVPAIHRYCCLSTRLNTGTIPRRQQQQVKAQGKTEIQRNRKSTLLHRAINSPKFRGRPSGRRGNNLINFSIRFWKPPAK